MFSETTHTINLSQILTCILLRGILVTSSLIYTLLWPSVLTLVDQRTLVHQCYNAGQYKTVECRRRSRQVTSFPAWQTAHSEFISENWYV